MRLSITCRAKPGAGENPQSLDVVVRQQLASLADAVQVASEAALGLARKAYRHQH